MNRGRKYFAIGIFSLSVVLFLGGNYFWNERSNKIDEEGILTECVITEIRGDYIRIGYTIGSDYYTYGVKRPYSHLQVGEKYEIKYHPEDPERPKVLYDQPILSDPSDYGTTECLFLQKKLISVWFEYEVNAVKYTRVNKLNTEESIIKSRYVVKYLKSNPEIGYLIKK